MAPVDLLFLSVLMENDGFLAGWSVIKESLSFSTAANSNSISVRAILTIPPFDIFLIG